MNMYDFFKIGDVIGGFCNGAFGRDDYDNKVCVLSTLTYAVFEYSEKREYAVVLNLSDVNKWINETIVNEWKEDVK